MPVTAKLSRKFYDALGDDVANELVEWFNSVDATYRSDLRDLNELNFSRFSAETKAGFASADSKLEQRLAQLRQEMQSGFARADAKLEQAIAQVRQEMEGGFARAAAKLEQAIAELRQEMEGGFARADAKLEQRTAELRQEMTQHSAALRAEIYGLRAHTDTGFERLRTELAAQRADLIKWMFVFWAPTALALIGLYAKR